MGCPSTVPRLRIAARRSGARIDKQLQLTAATILYSNRTSVMAKASNTGRARGVIPIGNRKALFPSSARRTASRRKGSSQRAKASARIPSKREIKKLFLIFGNQNRLNKLRNAVHIYKKHYSEVLAATILGDIAMATSRRRGRRRRGRRRRRRRRRWRRREDARPPPQRWSLGHAPCKQEGPEAVMSRTGGWAPRRDGVDVTMNYPGAEGVISVVTN